MLCIWQFCGFTCFPCTLYTWREIPACDLHLLNWYLTMYIYYDINDSKRNFHKWIIFGLGLYLTDFNSLLLLYLILEQKYDWSSNLLSLFFEGWAQCFSMQKSSFIVAYNLLSLHFHSLELHSAFHWITGNLHCYSDFHI